MQIKKFNELTAAYTVAAHEIGLIRPKAHDATDDEKFSEFVNDSEKAFSREHTCVDPSRGAVHVQGSLLWRAPHFGYFPRP
jgi:hypothetical protein